MDAEPRMRNRPLPFDLRRPSVDDPTQCLEDVRQPVNLVKDDKPVFHVIEEERRLAEPVAVVAVFQIEIERVS